MEKNQVLTGTAKKHRTWKAISNAKTHLKLADDKAAWVSVGKDDLETLVTYINTLEEERDSK